MARTIDLSDDRYQMRIWHGFTGDEDPPEQPQARPRQQRSQIRWLNRGLEEPGLRPVQHLESLQGLGQVKHQAHTGAMPRR